MNAIRDFYSRHSLILHSLAYGFGYTVAVWILTHFQAPCACTPHLSKPLPWPFFLPCICSTDVTGWSRYARLCFEIGMLGSVLAQTTVATFLTQAHAYRDIPDQDMPGRFFVEHFSNLVLIGLAFYALTEMDDPWAHIGWSIAYVAVVLTLDIRVRKWAIDSGRRSYRNRTLARICSDLMFKVDGLSLACLGLITAITLYVAEFFPPAASAIMPGQGHPTPNMPPGPSVNLAEIFLSGAFGLHFFVTTVLLAVLLCEWNTRFQRVQRYEQIISLRAGGQTHPASSAQMSAGVSQNLRHCR